MAASSFFGKRARECVLEMESCVKVDNFMGLQIVFLDRLIGMMFRQLVVRNIWRTIVVFRG